MLKNKLYLSFTNISDMKNFFLSLAVLLLFLSFPVTNYAQLATNFNCNDCNNVNHDLFTELDGGKIIVIAWVMPCTSCIGGALAAYSTVQNYQSSHPGRVIFYLVDDYANTSCSTLSSWANNNGMSSVTSFSNATIKMSDYGTDGMPKVVVLGGNSHTVYYNQNNNLIKEGGISTAIDQALLESTNGLSYETQKKVFDFYPNPSSEQLKIVLNYASPKVKLVLKNIHGQVLSTIYEGEKSTFLNEIIFPTDELSNGTYFIHYSDDKINQVKQLTILH